MIFNTDIRNRRNPERYNHVAWCGQSLAYVGQNARLSTTEIPRTLMFNGGFYGVDVANIAVAQPMAHIHGLVPMRNMQGQHPANLTANESPAYGFAAHLRSLASSYNLLSSIHAVGASDYPTLKKGTNPYARFLLHAQRAQQLLGPLRHRLAAIFCVHGEGDNGNSNYDTDIRQWQVDYEADGKEITGQSESVPMFHSQHSNWGKTNGSATSVSAFKQLDEFKANPTKTILVCPKYVFPYYTDGIHLSNTSSRWLGEYYAKAFWKHMIQGTQWNPLHPTNVQRTGSLITLTFSGNVGNLVLDTALVTNPGNYGFEYSDAGGPSATISSVTVTGSNTVEVALNTTPTGGSKKIRYGYTAAVGVDGGPTSGPRGNLRDSDTHASIFGNTLYNWCVHFNEDVP